MAKITGGCICGAIRYECDADPIVMLRCHCRDCQRISGGPYTPVMYVPLRGFKFTKGTPRHYSTESMMMRENKRSFCSDCGSRLTGGETSEGIGITAGTLDDPSQFRPAVDMHVADAQPWDHLDPASAKFDGYPPM